MAPPSPHIQFRARPPLADELRSRVDDPEDGGSLSYIAGESARQLFRLYAAELREMELSRDDCVMITAALWSTLVDSSWLERAPLILATEVRSPMRTTSTRPPTPNWLSGSVAGPVFRRWP